jgi:hypothetical protein
MEFPNSIETFVLIQSPISMIDPLYLNTNKTPIKNHMIPIETHSFTFMKMAKPFSFEHILK